MISETDKARDLRSTAADSRKQAPVFVVGCPRSGTTVLYHMLLSAGGFAIYRSESNVFNLLAPRFRGMRSARDRSELMDAWLHSMLFRVSGLDAEKIRARVMAECGSGGDFLRIVMGEVARNQGVERWADCTPEHLLFMKEIKRQIPDALFVHIIRDGRDVALSYLKQGWAHPLPWDEKEQLEVTGLYWNWIVGKGRAAGKALGAAYREVRFEDLTTHPRETLAGLGEFVGHDLDYDTIRSVGIGSVREPNSSFGAEDGAFDPVGRWKTKIPEQQLKEFEALTGDRLEELGYALASGKHSSSLRALRLRATYFAMFEGKHWMKTHTPLGRRVRLGRIGIDPPAGG
ncbi:MAG TPA: sulfotransferase [Candidatus Sulfotelmatobacter sp.]|nr:sulfotransferase [Candidatus Sulfotelmatobacter sp.]